MAGESEQWQHEHQQQDQLRQLLPLRPLGFLKSGRAPQMYYQKLPLYLKLNILLKYLYGIVHNLPKEYKHSLGSDILSRNWRLLDLFVKAQLRGKEKKKATIAKLNYQYEVFKLRVRFLSELRLISLKQTVFINSNLVEIGKMIGSWLKKQ